jgi:uncharacterized protein (DUF934 family)
MPRRLLRDGVIVADEWRTLAEAEAAGEPPGGPLLVPLARFRAERERWLGHGLRLGVILAPSDALESVVEHLPHLALVAAEFTGPGEGRGYTQGRLLRERHGFSGELRACGYVRRDQLFFMARCGFNSFELPDAELEIARSALATFSAAYQRANDRGLARPLRHR